MNSIRGMAGVLVMLLLVARPSFADPVGDQTAIVAELLERVERLEAAVALYQQFIVIEPAEIDGLPGPHLILEGVNVHVRNGTGSTTTKDGLGNLVLGWNETGGETRLRTGSHNLVIGRAHQFTGSAGLAAGERSTISGHHATVTGGYSNSATGQSASVAGGGYNNAPGNWASVCGGSFNSAGGDGAAVAGGQNNLASGYNAAVSGGLANEARGSFSSVGGGNGRVTTGNLDWRAGGLFQDF